MFTLRCTKKLLDRMRVKPDLQPPPSTTKLGDWYADTLNLGRERLVLCVSELTLLPVVVPALGAAVDLNAKLARGLRETLEALGASRRRSRCPGRQGRRVEGEAAACTATERTEATRHHQRRVRRDGRGGDGWRVLSPPPRWLPKPDTKPILLGVIFTDSYHA